jgi:hypothetical protein
MMQRRRIVAAAAATFALLRFPTMSIAQQDAWGEANALRLVIRSTDYLERARAALGLDGSTLAARPLVADLHAVVVLDMPDAVRGVDKRHLDALKLTQEQAFEIATRQTLASLPPLLQSAPPVQRGRIGHFSGNVYEVGRVAVHSEWAALAEQQGGTLLIVLPTTDVMLYVPEATPAAIGALRKFAEQSMSKATNPLSSAVLKWTKDGWEAVTQ